MSHGYVPSSFLLSTITPIPKNPRLDLRNSEDYRAIALSSVFGKFFDKIVIEKQVEQLGTSELQFGYKTKSSTVVCSTVLMETIEYYISRKTTVYVLLIDASKAFDCVSHIKQFNTLQAHGVCPLIIQVLYNMFTNSDMQVRWKSELSIVFPLMNGLIQKLKHSGIGCHIGRTYCGIFGYADDLAIVSPTLFGLRKMIEIFEEYASEMDLLFNTKSLNYYVIRCETCCLLM